MPVRLTRRRLSAAVATYDPRGANGYPMKNITIGGVPYAQVFGSTLPGPIWKDAMEAALATVPETKFDLVTLDGLGVYVPPPPKPRNPKPDATPSPGTTDGATPPPGPTTKPTATATPKPSPQP